MRNLKKILALVLALMMAVSMMATASAAEYPDAADIDYDEAAIIMSALGFFQGNEDGEFMPDVELTRNVAAKLIAIATLGKEMAEDLAVPEEDPFLDVPAADWAAKYINYCANAGILDGDGQGHFYPTAQLDGYSFVKLLLNAVGMTGEYTGSNWENNVNAAYKKTTMIKAAIANLDLEKVLTRDQACQLTFLALQESPAGEVSYTYTVKVDGVENKTFTSASEAKDHADILTSLNVGTVTIEMTRGASDSLAVSVFGLVQQNDDVDAFGRATNVWTANGWDDPIEVVKETADKVFTSAQTGLANGALKDYQYAQSVTVYEDGVVDQLATIAAASDIEALCAANKTVEVYVTTSNNVKTVTKVVVTNIYVDVIDAQNGYTAAQGQTPAYITLTNANDLATIPAGEFTAEDKGAWVLYTKGEYDNQNSKYTVQTIKAAEVLTGTLAGANGSKYTIGGKEYSISNLANNFAEADMLALWGKEANYVLDPNGAIIYGAEPGNQGGGNQTVTPTGYAWVLDTLVTGADPVSATDWTEAKDATWAVKVKVLLDNGTIAIYSMPVVEGTGSDEGKFYVKDGDNSPIQLISDMVAEGQQAPQSPLTLNAVYGYTLADGVISLVSQVAPVDGSEAETGIYLATPDSTLTSITVADTVNSQAATVLYSANTSVILSKPNDNNGAVVVKSGIAAIEASQNVTGDVLVKVTVSKNAQNQTVRTYEAVTVNASSVDFAASQNNPTADSYVYLPGTYTLAQNTSGQQVTFDRVYDIVKADGSKGTVTVTGNSGNALKGIFEYDSVQAKLVDTNEDGGVEATVGTISGNTYQLTDSQPVTAYLATTAATKTIVVAEGATLVSGAKVCYLAGQYNDLVLIFVIQAAQ